MTTEQMLLTAMLGAFPVLGGAIGWMWLDQKKSNEQLVASLKTQADQCDKDRRDCEEDRENQWAAMLKMGQAVVTPHPMEARAIVANIESMAPSKVRETL